MLSLGLVSFKCVVFMSGKSLLTKKEPSGCLFNASAMYRAVSQPIQLSRDAASSRKFEQELKLWLLPMINFFSKLWNFLISNLLLCF